MMAFTPVILGIIRENTTKIVFSVKWHTIGCINILRSWILIKMNYNENYIAAIELNSILPSRASSQNFSLRNFSLMESPRHVCYKKEILQKYSLLVKLAVCGVMRGLTESVQSSLALIYYVKDFKTFGGTRDGVYVY